MPGFPFLCSLFSILQIPTHLPTVLDSFFELKYTRNADCFPMFVGWAVVRSIDFFNLLRDGVDIPLLSCNGVGFDIDKVPGLLELARNFFGVLLGFVASLCCQVGAFGKTVGEDLNLQEWLLIGEDVFHVFERGRCKHDLDFD